jgi:hypothetical protein
VGATARRLPALADAIRDAEALSIEVCIKKRARGGGPLALAAAADRRFTIVFDVAPHLPPQILLQTLRTFQVVSMRTSHKAGERVGDRFQKTSA